MKEGAVLREVYTRGRAALARRRVAASIRELQPGRAVPVGDEDFLVLSVIRDAEQLIGRFVEHSLGSGLALYTDHGHLSRLGTRLVAEGVPPVNPAGPG
jgi:hypothetical protein